MKIDELKIERNSKVGIVCCSNPLRQSEKEKVYALEKRLTDIGLVPVFSDCMFEGGTVLNEKERASILMKFYEDTEIKGIFDISGGDISNSVLPYLDYEKIKNSKKILWGYSDLTAVLNAIYTKTGNFSVLYQIKNLVYDKGDIQKKNFTDTLNAESDGLFNFDFNFIQKTEMSGTVIGGNIRCFLKLAGTEYMPDFSEKILFLESLRGDAGRIETYFSQLKQLGAFKNVNGILLGTFTEMQERKISPSTEEIALHIIGKNVPVAVTRQIGHGTDSKALIIGRKMTLKV